MDTLNKLFGYYDNLIAHLSPATQNIVSLLLLLILLWQIFMIIKSGHWIFIAALIIMLPGTWPAARHIGDLVLAVFKFLLLRVAA